MPRRPASASPSRPSARTLARLRRRDISCTCKCSLIVSCAVGAQPGCRERQRDGTCGCKPRWLPTCILEPGQTHGCARWREGKQCQCPRLYMPRCLVVGCNDRRKGHRCECPRTPTERCPHVLSRIAVHADMTFAEANRKADAWAEDLWTLLPAEYDDRPLADEGRHVQSREAAVALMTIRQSLGLSLWHPDDERGIPDDDKQTRRQAAGLRRLLAAPTNTNNGKRRAA